MSEQPPVPTAPPRERQASEAGLPRWVPTFIGIVLVLMAALAVYTGIRFRNPTLANGIIKNRRPPRMTGGGPPGEPEPGASLVFPENSPTAGGPAVVGAVQMSARRGLMVNVTPEDAMVYVNGVAIGEARQFNTVDKVYDFPSEGPYTVRIVAPGYKDAQFVITANENAQVEVARIDARLERSAP
ncbi:MAG: PEGA domain-containing protein [Acidobacteriota bacterium]|nr:PEGA domain-containing protein [Acidobacteriota bacterium]